MKRLLLPLSLSITLFSYGQTQGDISSYPVVSGTHDPNNCTTEAYLGYGVTINNSFVGDSVKFVYPNGGGVFFAMANTSGQNPWYINTPPLLYGMAEDRFVAGGIAFIHFQDTKIISGPDTLYLNNYGTVPVPAPCSYGDVSGKVYVDANADCVFNAGDTPLNGVFILHMTDVTNPLGSHSIGGGIQTNASGDYSAQLQQTWMTDYTVSLPSHYPFIFPLSPCAAASHTYTALPQAGADFPLQCADIDVSTGIYHTGAVRPAIPFILSPRVQNEGCDAATGTLKLVLDARVTYNAALSTNPPAAVSGDTLTWNYANLTNLALGGYWNTFISGLHLTPDPSVNIGDTLCFRLSASVPANDINPANNESRLCVSVVNSYDPNIKEVTPKGTGPQGFIPASVHELTYTVHFQNTGNAPAIDVRVQDSLSVHIDPASLRILASSHAMSPMWLSPGVVSFQFSQINLPDSSSNEPASHGFVTFKVRLRGTVQPGDEIPNRAHIYFDTNPPVITNTALNTIITGSGIENLSASEFSVYPNPGTGIFRVRLPYDTPAGSRLTVYNLTGQPVFGTYTTENVMQIDLTHLPAGLYVLGTDGPAGHRQRLIKQ